MSGSRPAVVSSRLLPAAVPTILMFLALLAPAGAGAGEGPLLVVWIEHPGDPDPETLRAAARLLEEAGHTVVADRSPVPPDGSRERETLAVFRAAAVIWHGGGGDLRVLLAGGGGPESFGVAAGSADEEALYIRELLAARVLGENPSADLLITAPEEVVVSREPRQLTVTRPRAGDRPPPRAEVPPLTGPRLAMGWRMRIHLDEAAWLQHGITAHLPAWRFASGAELRVAGAVGLPARIGEPGVTWLELTDLELGFEAGVRPLRGRTVDAELYVGVGAYRLRAEAFLPDGTTRSSVHLAGQLTAGARVAWRLWGWLEARLGGGVHRVLGPGSFSIGGSGDFGAEPWQPFAGLDLSVALPGG